MAPQSKEAWNNLGAVAAEMGDTRARARSARQGDRARRRLPRRVVQPRHDLRAGGQAERRGRGVGQVCSSSTPRAAGPTSQSSTARVFNRRTISAGAISRSRSSSSPSLRRRCTPSRRSICASPPSRPKARAGRARSKRSRARSNPARTDACRCTSTSAASPATTPRWGAACARISSTARSRRACCARRSRRRSPSFAFRG